MRWDFVSFSPLPSSWPFCRSSHRCDPEKLSMMCAFPASRSRCSHFKALTSPCLAPVSSRNRNHSQKARRSSLIHASTAVACSRVNGFGGAFCAAARRAGVSAGPTTARG